MPTFAFLKSPVQLTLNIHPRENAPLPISYQYGMASVDGFMPVYYRCPPRSTSELLRTL